MIKTPNSKQARTGASVSSFRVSDFRFVSDFELRVSDFEGWTDSSVLSRAVTTVSDNH